MGCNAPRREMIIQAIYKGSFKIANPLRALSIKFVYKRSDSSISEDEFNSLFNRVTTGTHKPTALKSDLFMSDISSSFKIAPQYVTDSRVTLPSNSVSLHRQKCLVYTIITAWWIRYLASFTRRSSLRYRFFHTTFYLSWAETIQLLRISKSVKL